VLKLYLELHGKEIAELAVINVKGEFKGHGYGN